MQVNVSSGSEPTFVYGVMLVQTHRWSYNRGVARRGSGVVPDPAATQTLLDVRTSVVVCVDKLPMVREWEWHGCIACVQNTVPVRTSLLQQRQILLQ